MKSIMRIILSIILMIFGINANGTVSKILATENKTTTIMFPSGIVHVDLGCENPYIAITVDESVPNLVKLRLSNGFKGTTTNLLVVTQDENVYSFEVEYADSIGKYVYIVNREDAVNYSQKNNMKIDTIKSAINNPQKDSLSASDIMNRILQSQGGFIRSETAKKGKVTLCLKSIYVYNNDLYFHLEINNKSNLKYNVDFYNLFMTSNTHKTIKGTVTQDIQVPFTFIHPEVKEIKAGNIENIILHVKKFTLEDDKIACLEIYEKEGGRHLKIKIGNNELLSAEQL